MPRLTSESLSLISRHSSEMPKIALIANEHDDDIAIRVVPEFLQPSRDIDVCGVLGNVVDEQRANCATVVC